MRVDTLCFLVKDDPIEQVLLGVKKRGFGEGNIVGVGGRVEFGETLAEGALREFYEETGVQLDAKDLDWRGQLTFLFPAEPKWDRVVHLFFVRQWPQEPQESDEIDPIWVDLAEIPYAQMWPDAVEWLPRVLAGEQINGRYVYNDDNITIQQSEITPPKDYLHLHLKDLPYFRALLRAVEAGYYQSLDLRAPIYDLGCGDGHFASLTFDFKLHVGLDPWSGPIREAQGFGAYQSLVQADGAQTPFPDDHFGSALSNSVLEHIEHIDAVLAETGRILRPGAPFYFCVPNPDYYTALAIPAILRKLKLGRLAGAYLRWFAKISRVYHADWPEVWQQRLTQAGFELERSWHYFPPKSMRVLEWGHYFGLPSLIVRWLTGRWLLSRKKWNLALTDRFVRPHAIADEIEDGTFTFFIARKV